MSRSMAVVQMCKEHLTFNINIISVVLFNVVTAAIQSLKITKSNAD